MLHIWPLKATENIWYYQQFSLFPPLPFFRLGQVDVSVKQSIIKETKKKNPNHFTLKPYLCSTIHRFRVNIWDPWQACSVQSTYLPSSIWAWIWWSGCYPTWHCDKINSIVCSAQGQRLDHVSLSFSVSLSPVSNNRQSWVESVSPDDTTRDKIKAKPLHLLIQLICYKHRWLLFSPEDIWGKNQTFFFLCLKK